jgi:hypothetical protein
MIGKSKSEASTVPSGDDLLRRAKQQEARDDPRRKRQSAKRIEVLLDFREIANAVAVCVRIARRCAHHELAAIRDAILISVVQI